MEIDLNLEELLSDICPNLVTPHLDKITGVGNDRKPKEIAELIIVGMANSVEDPIQKEIMHDGAIHNIRFVNVDPLLKGPWASISLMLLSLSYGEQATIIEAIYPDRLQLTAKSFAVAFTQGLKQTKVTVKQDGELVDRVDSANAGIAMILSILKKTGTIPHADEVEKSRSAMDNLVAASKERDEYRKDFEKSQDLSKSKDGIKL